MVAQVPELPLGVDPLIAEAKRRMLRRRVGLAGLVAVCAGVLTYGLLPPGWLSSPRAGQGAQSSQSLARLKVPLDQTERQWRATVRSISGRSVESAAVLSLRQRVLSIAEATGAVPIRVKIWPRTSPPGVEIVAATSMNPADYLRHRAGIFVNAFPRRVFVKAGKAIKPFSRSVFVKIVNRHGSMIFEWGGAANMGFVGAPPALMSCSPVMPVSLIRPSPPCPAG